MTLISFVSYLLDAYPPQGTLSALTATVCSRLSLAGVIPIVIRMAITNIGGGLALSTFGLIAAAFSLFPFVLFFFRKKTRTSSRFYNADHLSPVEE
jgi:MFS transporter, DHA1 family, multidrug resistance protein